MTVLDAAQAAVGPKEVRMGSKRLKVGVTATVIAVAALVTASFATGAPSKAASAGKVGSCQASAAKSVCGLGNGKKATGSSIKIGAIATKQAGTDFTDIPNMAAAYFACVNDNGGINGHRIAYTIQPEQTDPAQVAALAKKLIGSTHVVAIVGNTSIIDCAVNHKYYEAQGFYVIDSGIAPECYATSHSAAVNMGPRYSSDGAAQFELRQGVKKIVFDQSNVPGTGYNAGGVELIAKAAGVPEVSLTDDVPIQDGKLRRTEARAGRGPERRRRPELHAGPGARHPAGRPEAGHRQSGEGVVVLDAVQLRLRRSGARLELGQRVRRQRRVEPHERVRP